MTNKFRSPFCFSAISLLVAIPLLIVGVYSAFTAFAAGIPFSSSIAGLLSVFGLCSPLLSGIAVAISAAFVWCRKSAAPLWCRFCFTYALCVLAVLPFSFSSSLACMFVFALPVIAAFFSGRIAASFVSMALGYASFFAHLPSADMISVRAILAASFVACGICLSVVPAAFSRNGLRQTIPAFALSLFVAHVLNAVFRNIAAKMMYATVPLALYLSPDFALSLCLFAMLSAVILLVDRKLQRTKQDS